MKLAFLIAAHAYPELLARLVQRLQSPVSSVFIHLDQRADIRPFQTLFLERGIHGVHWVPRLRCRWGTLDQIKVSLLLLREATSMDPHAGMFLLLSGQDYPLRTPEFMSNYFEKHHDTSFITWARLPWSIWPDAGGFNRLTHYHFVIGQNRLEFPAAHWPAQRALRLAYWLCHVFLKKDRRLPADLTFYGGLSWWNLTREAVQCIFEYLRNNPGYLRLFRHSKCGDEIFFQTLLFNSKPLPIKNNDLRCVFWDGRRNEYPAIVRNEDFEEIKQSAAFFTRKTHPEYSAALVERIDDELLGRRFRQQG